MGQNQEAPLKKQEAEVFEICTTQEELDRRMAELQFHLHCLQIILELTQTEMQKLNLTDLFADQRSQSRKVRLARKQELLRLLTNVPQLKLEQQSAVAPDADSNTQQQGQGDDLFHRLDWLETMIQMIQGELETLPSMEGAMAVEDAACVVITSRDEKPVCFHDHPVRPFDPAPTAGLRRELFRKICENGFGDRHNSYSHSMVWFNGHLYVGTTRTNLCLIRKALPVKIDFWPVDCSTPIYSPEFERAQARAEIWRYDPERSQWSRVFQSPLIEDGEGGEMSRELGYRRMEVFQGASDRAPALYVSTWSRSRSTGMLILRSDDGERFTPVSQPGLVGLNITSIRSLVSFQGRLFAAPTGGTGTRANISEIPIIYESTDPASGEWRPCNEPGFGDMGNRTVFELFAYEDFLYAGTANNSGYQIWRTRAEGRPPYKWEQVIREGAGRGSLNQFAVSMIAFNGAVYVGSGIQNGGFDRINRIGPAGAELIRINPSGSWDLVVGDERDTPQGYKKPLSGLRAGFGNLFNGYIWKMAVHDGWLYAGTMNWSIILRFLQWERSPDRIRHFFESIGVENLISHQGGFHLWRTKDGENWLPVCRQGFGNAYNYGARNLISTPHGLFVGTANPFGPRVAVRKDGQWEYADNPNGGMEVWLGNGKDGVARKR
jgi:hypothetical protein